MGMDLTGAGGHFHFTITEWDLILQLAEAYGWEPEGTKLPGPGHDTPDQSWSGTYFTNSYQLVTREDAAALAEALERSLPDLPDHDALEHKAVDVPVLPADVPRLRAAGLLAPGETSFKALNDLENVTPVEFFSGPRKQDVLDFIAYCRAGEFCIG